MGACARLTMWLLARPPTPEELILNVTSSALRLVDAIHTITAASTSGTDQTDADAAAATVDKHLRELKLILIGSLTLTVHHLYLFLL